MSEQEKTTRIIYSQPVQIELTRSAKGVYHWQVKVSSEDQHSALFLIDEIDKELRIKYLGNETQSVSSPKPMEIKRSK